MNQGTPFPVCPNGHQQPSANTRFCIYCGVAVFPSRADGQNSPPPIQPVMPPQFQPNFAQVPTCTICGGDGRGLPANSVMCKECRWLRPLVPGYTIPNEAFAWAADAKAMAALKAIKPLNMAAKAVSEKVGRRWIEVSFNGIPLSERQMPHIFGQSVRAARILGMSHMPDVYISGDRPWDCLTFGTDKDSFIVIGSAIAGNYQGVDMLYLLAREMGHCKTGHALWKTVIRFFLGEQGPAKGFMAGGIFNAILSPTAMIGGAIEMPLLAWARQAEITADRAGLIAVADEAVARRTLLSWSLKSSFILRQINIEEWLAQQETDAGDMSRLSELTTTSTPYLGPRVKLLHQFATSEQFKQTVDWIKATIASAAPKPSSPAPDNNAAAASPDPNEFSNAPAFIRIKCASCSTPMRVSKAAADSRPKFPVKCPNPKCGKITVISKKTGAAVKNADEKIREENQNYGE